MGIVIKGLFRVQSIYEGDSKAYLTLKDKSNGEIVKLGVELPLPKTVVDDGLIDLDGPLASQVYQNNVGLTYTGVIKAGAEK